jgi:hypothetical protein
MAQFFNSIRKNFIRCSSVEGFRGQTKLGHSDSQNVVRSHVKVREVWLRARKIIFVFVLQLKREKKSVSHVFNVSKHLFVWNNGITGYRFCSAQQNLVFV